MSIPDWQRRVIDEYRVVRENISRLREFIRNNDLDTIENVREDLLRLQECHMIEYRDVLAKRIDSFGLGYILDLDFDHQE